MSALTAFALAAGLVCLVAAWFLVFRPRGGSPAPRPVRMPRAILDNNRAPATHGYDVDGVDDGADVLDCIRAEMTAATDPRLRAARPARTAQTWPPQGSGGHSEVPGQRDTEEPTVRTRAVGAHARPVAAHSRTAATRDAAARAATGRRSTRVRPYSDPVDTASDFAADAAGAAAAAIVVDAALSPVIETVAADPVQLAADPVSSSYASSGDWGGSASYSAPAPDPAPSYSPPPSAPSYDGGSSYGGGFDSGSSSSSW